MKLSASLVFAAAASSLMPTASATFNLCDYLNLPCCSTAEGCPTFKEWYCSKPENADKACCADANDDCEAFGPPTLFEIDCDFQVGGTDWNIGDGETNTLDLSYVLNGVTASFTTDITDCDTAGVGSSINGVTGSPASVVEFVNTGPVTDDPSTTYCAKIVLKANDVVVATRECKFEASANDSGDAENFDGTVDTFVEVNGQTQYMDEDAEIRTAEFEVICTSPIAWNQIAQVIINGLGDAIAWYWTITDVVANCGTTSISLIPAAPTTEVGTSTAYFIFSNPDDFACFAPGQTIQITVYASWSLTNRRALQDGQGQHLRALQDGQGQQSGEIEETVSVEVDSSSIPQELGSSDATDHSILKIAGVTLAAGAALIAV